MHAVFLKNEPILACFNFVKCEMKYVWLFLLQRVGILLNSCVYVMLTVNPHLRTLS